MRNWLVAAIVLTVLFGAYVIGDIHASFEYENTVGSYWNLSVKASTLQQKFEYLNKYVAALDAAHLSGSSALFWQTPDESYEQNYNALKSLQTRMAEIQSMNVKSFEYQQAISQITAQEQDEAHHILSVFSSVWMRQNHPIYWGWGALIFGMGGFVAMLFAWIGVMDNY